MKGLPSFHLELIGYWSGGEKDNAIWPDADPFIAEANYPNQQKVIDYLAHGNHMPYVICGMSHCRICGISNGAGEFTDGYFVWPEGLVHYVRDHNLRLPKRFEKHVLSKPTPIIIPEETYPFQLNTRSEWWKKQK